MKFVVFQHVDIGSPGIFGKLMRQDALTFDIIKLYEGQNIPDLAQYHALIILGGPMNVWEEDQHPWLRIEKRAIQEFALALRRPVLGICLGHQLLAEALGGTVGPMTTAEIGISLVRTTSEANDDFLFSKVPDSFRCVQWHGSEIKTLPPHAAILARNNLCEIQAFRFAQHAYGVQFHPEVETSTIHRWLQLPSFRQALARERSERVIADFAEAADAQINIFNCTAETIYRQFRKLAFVG